MIAHFATTDFATTESAPVLQIEQICQDLSQWQAIASDAPLMESTQMGLVLGQDQYWRIRPITAIQPGQRVEIVGVQDGTLLAHVGKCGTVQQFRSYAVQDNAKVRLDGYAVDLILPLVCFKVMVSPAATRLEALKEQYKTLAQHRQHVLAQGDVLKRKPEIFATVKNRKAYGNVNAKSGAKGYAFRTVLVNGRKRRFSISPNELAQYEAAYKRGQEVRRIDRELKRLRREIDRLSAIANVATLDPTSKKAGQLDLRCTRATPDQTGGFSYRVFRWKAADGCPGGLRPGKVIKRFEVPQGTDAATAEMIRHRAIAFVESRQ